ncbi:MAG: hypothetical protein HFJ52_02170 [Clostridia bacterium]|nr:hypothetical protein [Clostridia bacterium]
MRSLGEFIFKGIETRKAGEFLNNKGETVKYPEAFILKVDEVVDGSINERKLRVDINNTMLISRLKKINPYDKFQLECDVVLYQNGAKVVPIAVVDSKQ